MGLGKLIETSEIVRRIKTPRGCHGLVTFFGQQDPLCSLQAPAEYHPRVGGRTT